MGKIRVSTLGDEEAEKKQKEEAQKRRLAKKLEKEGTKTTEKSEQKKETKKVSKETKKETKKTNAAPKEELAEETKKTPLKPRKVGAKIRSARYKEIRTLVDSKRYYTLDEALALVKQTSKTKFTGSVEAHFNLSRVVKVKNADGIKVERKSPLAHAKLGKTTDSDSVLKEKFQQTLKVLGTPNVKKIVLNATMGPGIKVTQ